MLKLVTDRTKETLENWEYVFAACIKQWSYYIKNKKINNRKWTKNRNRSFAKYRDNLQPSN